jgi:uncharacterized membrane protein (UPF0127 family)
MGSAVTAECRPDRVDLRGDWGTARFTVELAQTREEISVGLMNRPSMPASAGMLFVYEAPRAAYFWMKNTLIPLDMLFVSPEGVVSKVHENAVPLDETVIPGGDNVQYVLEINGGMAARLGIAAGSELRHPSIPASRAAWPCE